MPPISEAITQDLSRHGGAAEARRQSEHIGQLEAPHWSEQVPGRTDPMKPAALRRGTGSSTGSSRVVNKLEAKSHFSRLVEAIKTGAEVEVVIARGQFVAPHSIDAANPLIAELFEQG